MKAIFIFLGATLNQSFAQNIYFPDPELKSRLVSASVASITANPNVTNACADSNQDGEITYAEAALVTGLMLSSGPGQQLIHSLEGLQHFANLQVLRCNGNGLWGLPNGVWAVKVLEVANNNIEFINAHNLPFLQRLTCSGNPISAIDLDELWELRELTIRNTNITELDCRMTGVVRLDCGQNPNLAYINIQNGQLWNSGKASSFGPFKFDNLPSLSQICLDADEAGWLNHSFFDADNVQVYAGPHCSSLSNQPGPARKRK